MRRISSVDFMLKIREIQGNSQEGQRIMKQIYDMRFEVYTDLGWNSFSKENSRMVKDEFDESPHTTHFAILENGKVIGSQRATRYSHDDKLPFFKDGHTFDLFKTTNISISELSRLILRQDRKYPGCVLQLAYNTANYALNNLSELVCTIGIASSKDLFEYMGAKQVNDKMGCLVDRRGEEEMLVINAIPTIVDKSTLNHNIPLDKYKMNRTLIILKSQEKKFTWDNFWTRFSKEAYDYTNLLPENKKMLDKTSSLVGNNKNVLDAGCGTGNLSIKLAEKNRVTALDLNTSMLEVAAEKTKQNNTVTFKKGDVTKLPFGNNTFDAVTSVNVLYHLDNPIDAIKEAERVLKYGGLFIIASPLKGAALSKEFVDKVTKDCREGNVNMEKFNKLKDYNKILFEKRGLKFTPTFQEMEKLLISHAFEIVHKERVYYGMNFLICAKKN